MINNYYQAIKLITYDKTNLSNEELINAITNHAEGFDVEFMQQQKAEGRLILMKNGTRFKKLRILECKGRRSVLQGEDVYVSFWNAPRQIPNYINPKRRNTHASRAIKALYELIPEIEAHNLKILQEFNAI